MAPAIVLETPFDGLFIFSVLMANVLWTWMLVINSSRGHKIHFWYVDPRHISKFKDIIRNSRPSDHQRIICVMKGWWGGRDLTWMLPKLFLVHFCNISFVMEKDDELIAFFIGFLSPSRANEGYIHFAGVHPDFRGMGIGESLYDRFFGICKENGRNIIRACTSPVNKESVDFHKKIGFEISNGNAEINGIQVTLDYNKPNDPKVLFEIEV